MLELCWLQDAVERVDTQPRFEPEFRRTVSRHAIMFHGVIQVSLYMLHSYVIFPSSFYLSSNPSIAAQTSYVSAHDYLSAWQRASIIARSSLALTSSEDPLQTPVGGGAAYLAFHLCPHLPSTATRIISNY